MQVFCVSAAVMIAFGYVCIGIWRLHVSWGRHDRNRARPCRATPWPTVTGYSIDRSMIFLVSSWCEKAEIKKWTVFSETVSLVASQMSGLASSTSHFLVSCQLRRTWFRVKSAAMLFPINALTVGKKPGHPCISQLGHLVSIIVNLTLGIVELLLFSIAIKFILKGGKESCGLLDWLF